jgi:hypothetical protein
LTRVWRKRKTYRGQSWDPGTEDRFMNLSKTTITPTYLQPEAFLWIAHCGWK